MRENLYIVWRHGEREWAKGIEKKGPFDFDHHQKSHAFTGGGFPLLLFLLPFNLWCNSRLTFQLMTVYSRRRHNISLLNQPPLRPPLTPCRRRWEWMDGLRLTANLLPPLQVIRRRFILLCCKTTSYMSILSHSHSLRLSNWFNPFNNVVSS